MRKKTLFLLITFATLFVCGCEKGTNFDENTIPNDAILLTTEGFCNNSKTSVQGTGVQWENEKDTVILNGTKYAVHVNNRGQAYVENCEIGGTIYGYYPANINGNWSEPTLNVTIPSEYKSIISGENQIISLPMAAYVPIVGSSIQFKHLTAAILVRVRNNTGETIYLDSIIVKSETQQLSGNKSITLVSGGNPILTAATAVNDNQKRVKVFFSNESVSINNGGNDIKEIQVPILPIDNSINDLTVMVFTHSKKIRVGVPTVNYDYDFSLSTDAPVLGRNVMAILQVDINTQANSNRITEIDHSLFTVAINGDGTSRQVRFSMGNLRCSRYNTAIPWSGENLLWSFFDSQLDMEEVTANPYCTEDYGNKNTISLFGWGTSGNGDATCKYPYSTNSSDGSFGPQINSGEFDYEKYDWGYNAINNGGNTLGLWRTLSGNEWDCILGTGRTTSRTNASNKKGLATINGTTGLVILPDNWKCPDGCSFIATTSAYDYNIYTIEQWNIMESNGAIFLPAAGGRNGTNVENVGRIGIYWTSTAANYYNQAAYYMGFGAGFIDAVMMSGRSTGRSVRLVQDY